MSDLPISDEQLLKRKLLQEYHLRCSKVFPAYAVCSLSYSERNKILLAGTDVSALYAMIDGCSKVIPA